jgi:hypothetical protein
MLKCDLRKTTQELELNERIVLENEHFVAMCCLEDIGKLYE